MLRLLAEGGGAVEALWKCRERGEEAPKFQTRDAAGNPVGESPEAASLRMIAAAVTQAKARGTHVPLYEITVAHGGFSARIDLLRVHRDRLEVIEMKAKSVVAADVFHEGNTIVAKNSASSVTSGWVPYIQDLAFQRVLVEMWLAERHAEIGLSPTASVVPGLILVNKAQHASAHDTLGNFRTEYRLGKGGLRPEVTYVGTGAADSLLLVDMQGVPKIVGWIEEDAQARDPLFAGLGIRECMATMRQCVELDHWPEAADRRGVRCKKCEYRTKGGDPSGFDECWGAGATGTRHHVLTLSRVTDDHVQGAIASASGPHPLVLDVPVELLEPAPGKDEGPHVKMRKLQYRCLAAAPPEGRPALKVGFASQTERETILRRGAPVDPCYFLDFECGIYPIPQRVGGHAYEYVPFQFEGHVLPAFDAPLEARRRLEGFLDLESDDPTLGFVRALRRQLGDHGIIYHWHHYEASVLKSIRRRLQSEAPSTAVTDRDELITFIDSLVGVGDKGVGRFCDLLAIARESFYHPAQQGSYSIKKVLPIVWQVPEIRVKFQRGGVAASGDRHSYGSANDADGSADPYDSLGGFPRDFYEALGGPELAKVLEERIEDDDDTLPGQLKDGGMAMLYYHYVRLIGQGGREDRKGPFRDYCGLDSAAMVMVFRYMMDVVPGFDDVTRSM
jgi:hypothetical protein